MRRAVLMMRQAISPRLAIRIRLNIATRESRYPASRPLRRSLKMSMRLTESSITRRSRPACSVDTHVGLLDDDAVDGSLALDPLGEFGRARWNGEDPTGRELLFHVGHIEDFDDLGIELGDDRLRRGFGREQRRPVRRIDVA